MLIRSELTTIGQGGGGEVTPGVQYIFALFYLNYLWIAHMFVCDFFFFF